MGNGFGIFGFAASIRVVFTCFVYLTSSSSSSLSLSLSLCNLIFSFSISLHLIWMIYVWIITLVSSIIIHTKQLSISWNNEVHPRRVADWFEWFVSWIALSGRGGAEWRWGEVVFSKSFSQSAEVSGSNHLRVWLTSEQCSGAVRNRSRIHAQWSVGAGCRQ